MMPELNIDISKHLTNQFTSQLGLDPVTLKSNPEAGEGYMKYIDLPGRIELYHFVEHRPVDGSVRSVNSPDSEWYLIHINLSGFKQQKRVDGEVVELHKYAPAGMLLYCPGIDIFTPYISGKSMELASIRFHRSFISEYFTSDLIDDSRTFIYEDLDHESEQWLRYALGSMDNDRLACHTWVLKILHRFCTKLARHDKPDKEDQFHAGDIKGLFEASTHLRNPCAKEVPSITELATIAGMSSTKFKTAFRKMFGSPPGKYHIRIKMEYARDQILKGQQPVELSYELGYSHPSNFTAAFKKFFGELPSSIGK